jgi:predicted MFS family arabinose efflux permease
VTAESTARGGAPVTDAAGSADPAGPAADDTAGTLGPPTAESDAVAAEVATEVTDTAMDTPPPGVMHNRDFLKLWAGESVSLIGTQITTFALPLIAVLTLNASVFQVGLLNASRSAPVVVIALFAGVWLDRRRRRPILIGCSLGSGALIATIPLAFETHHLSMGLLYAVCLATAVLSVVFDVGVLSYIPSLVDRRHIAGTASRMQTSLSLAMVAGPGLAGALVGVMSAPSVLTLDAVSYFCSAIGLLTIRHREADPMAGQDRPSVRSSLAEGLRGVFKTKMLRDLLSQAGTFNLFQSGLITVLVVYALKVLRLSPFQLGLVLGAIAVGGILGSMNANKVRLAIGLDRTFVIGALCGSLCPPLLLIPSGNSVASISFLMVVEFVYGFGVLMFNVNTIALRQIVTPSRLQGRINAGFRMVVLGTQPLGAALGGLFAEHVGLRHAMDVVVTFLLLPLVWMTFSPIFRLKEMPAEPLPELELLDGKGAQA